MNTPQTHPREYRKFFNQLRLEDYLKLEVVAFQRGITPYSLSSLVLEAWLNGDLLPKEPERPGLLTPPTFELAELGKH